METFSKHFSQVNIIVRTLAIYPMFSVETLKHALEAYLKHSKIFKVS